MSISELKKYDFILASKSPRRQFLLKSLGLNFETHTKDVDESFPETLKAEEIPLYLSKKKAEAFDEELNDNTVVITADTIVWINGQVLNKPEDFDDAVRMLRMLSGNMHEVFTGVCLKSKEKTKTFFARTKVYFKPLSQSDIEYYIHNYKPYDKAGAYGAQECLPAGMNPCSEEEVKFLKEMNKLDLIESSRAEMKAGSGYFAVDRIDGPYFNVMGLPIKELYEELIVF
ncbi:MAG: septum formation inhibitor Maf [Bacteroidota bacterium]|jgi:septum formation protein|nr:septum formation inhibitor Maf [Bacteroidota bacterium]